MAHTIFGGRKKDLTPSKLLQIANDKMCILKHAGRWKESNTAAVMTLKLQLEKQENKTSDLFQQLTAHLTKLT